MRLLKRLPLCISALLAALVFASAVRAAAPTGEPFVGRWALSISGGAAGWLEIKKHNGWFDGSVLWGGGSVVPVSNVVIADGVLTVTRVRDLERKDESGKVLRK